MYYLFLATPEKIIFDGLISSMIVPGTAGYFEVLTNHAPIISSLTIGKLVVIDENNKKWVWAVSGGVVEISHNKANLLADAVELSSEIDIKRAEIAMKKNRRILDFPGKDADLVEANRALQRAKNRIKTSSE